MGWNFFWISFLKAVHKRRRNFFAVVDTPPPPFQILDPDLLKGPFTNYVYKRRGVGGQKNQLFVNFYTIKNVNGGG